MDGATPDIKLMAAASTAIPEAKGQRWKPGVIASFPYVGIGTLCLSIVCKRTLEPGHAVSLMDHLLTRSPQSRRPPLESSWRATASRPMSGPATDNPASSSLILRPSRTPSWPWPFPKPLLLATGHGRFAVFR